MKQQLIKFLKENIKYKIDYEKLIEKPKLESQGDFSLPVFTLSKELKKAPQIIAQDLQKELSKELPEFLQKIENIGPYINFYLNKTLESKTVLTSIIDNSALKIKIPNPQKILIEYPSPNTNKALHVGHVRNMLLGNSISKIFKKVGHKITKINLNNDRGIAICKAMLAYKLFGENKTPESENVKPDKFVGSYYVLFGDKNKKHPEMKLEEQAQEMLSKWEAGHKETIDLWNKIMKWVFAGYTKTYQKFKYTCDKEYFESKIYDKGKEIVLDALKKKIKGFDTDKENGAIYIDLEDKNLGKKYLLRGDMTTLYMTQDLYLAQIKQKEFKCDKYVFIVGNEQEYHFKVLFEILERIGFGGVNKNYHFSFGMLYDENGNEFSSRKGNVIEADELLNLVTKKAYENLEQKSSDLSKKEKEIRSKIIGYSALAFGILKINPLDNKNFDMNAALSMTGETGPYVQYTYSRIKSILKKASYKSDMKIDFQTYKDKEISLINSLKNYKEVVLEAAEKYKPSAIANYLIKVSQQFNEFYQNCPILNSDEKVKKARLLLCEATSKILKDGLELLDIETLEEM